MTRIVGIGNLVADLYYKNGELIGVDGGKTTTNIIANLSYLGFKTSIIGNCGNDVYGKIALDSLVRLGVDTSKVMIRDVKTKKIHIVIGENISSGRCPYCNKMSINKYGKMDFDYIKNHIKKTDILLIDNISEGNNLFINKLSKLNKIMIDISSYYYNLKYLSNEKILELLSDKFTIINMNERVEKYLLKTLNIDSMELFRLLKVRMLIITRGKKGADFIYDNKLVSKSLMSKGIEVDVSGAGDAFFAMVISSYINNDFNIDDSMIDKCFDKATEITKKVVSNVGARSHIGSLYKVKKINHICTCENVSLSD